eukprot:4304613-Prymnesium_polylepis.1
MDATRSCQLPRGSTWHPSWSCYEDRPGKPGWIANRTSGRVQQALTIPVQCTAAGFLVVGFLRSYAGMGRASVFIDGEKSMAVTLDGHWEEGTSQTQYSVVPLTRLVSRSVLGSGHRSSRHKVSLQVPAVDEEAAFNTAAEITLGKFKLVSLATC